MNGLFARIARLIAGPGPEVSVRDEAVQRYLACVEEWNDNCVDDDWADSERGIACNDYMQWFEGLHE